MKKFNKKLSEHQRQETSRSNSGAFALCKTNLFAIGLRVGITGGGSLTRPLLIAGATSATERSAVALRGAGSRHMSCSPAGAISTTGAAIESARADVKRGLQNDIVCRWLTRHLNWLGSSYTSRSSCRVCSCSYWLCWRCSRDVTTWRRRRHALVTRGSTWRSVPSEKPAGE